MRVNSVKVKDPYSKGQKAIYAPVPARAMADLRLKERHLRTLMVIAAHDRLGANGIGCWASHERLAAMVGCAYSRLSMNLRELGELGYIERIPHPLNKRLRVYKVIYNADDARTMTTVQKSVRDSSPAGEESAAGEADEAVDNSSNSSPRMCGKAPHSSPVGEVNGVHSSPRESAMSLKRKASMPVNIFRETENISCRNIEIHSAEAASSGDDALLASRKGDQEVNIGGHLARLERALRSGGALDLSQWRNWLETVIYDLDVDDPNFHRAGRLLEDVLDASGFYDDEGEVIGNG